MLLIQKCIEQYRIDFFNKLHGFIRTYALSTDNIVLCVDCNWCKERKRDKSFSKMMDIMKNYENIVFISIYFIYNVDKIIIRRFPGTLTCDTRLTGHRLLKFSVKLSDAKRSPGYWKLNASYLENNE